MIDTKRILWYNIDIIPPLTVLFAGKKKGDSKIMNAVKRTAIWLAAMLAIIFVVNAAGTIIVKKVVADTLLRASMGYSKRAERMIHPPADAEDEDEQRRASGSLAVRSLLSDDRIINEPGFFYNLLFLNFQIDVTNIFFDKDGLNELSSGILVSAYRSDRSDSGNLDHMKNTFGVVNINDFCKLDCAEEVYNALESDPGAVIQLNSYTISDYIVKPVSLTLLDADGNELLNVTCPYEGELIERPDCYIFNEYEDEGYDSDSLYHKMKLAFPGERRSDKIANELIDEVSFDNGDYSTDKTIYGLGNMSMKYIELTGDYSQITVLHIQFIKGVIFYTVILGGIMSIIMFLVIKKRSY